MRSNIWKLVTIILGSVIILVSVAFAIPVKEISYETTERYYETEIQKIPHVKDKPLITKEFREQSETIFDGYVYAVPGGINIPFRIDRIDARLSVVFESSIPGGFRIYSDANSILYEKLSNRGTVEINLPRGMYRAQFREDIMWGHEVYIQIVLKWTEQEETTVTQEVLEYWEIPVQVEKERVVTKHKKISIWKLIFSDDL